METVEERYMVVKIRGEEYHIRQSETNPTLSPVVTAFRDNEEWVITNESFAQEIIFTALRGWRL